MNRKTRRAVAVSLTLVALAAVFTTLDKPVHMTYLPLIAHNASFQAPKLHSLQLGYTKHNRIPAYQEALGLTGGGDQLLLAPENSMQTVQVVEFFDYWLDRGLGIQPHVLTYSKAERRFTQEAEAIAWIKANPGKRYIIGNEPDGPYSGGGHDMTPSEYADFAHAAITLIKGADRSAYLIMAAWAGGVGEPSTPAHNENAMLSLYYGRYGMMDVRAVSWHSYQSGTYNRSYPADKLNRFASYARTWKSRGWIPSDDIILTEFGWYGFDTVNNTPENCIAFMDWFIPKLQAHEQVRAWYFWEWGASAMLMRNGEPTEVGLYYAGLED